MTKTTLTPPQLLELQRLRKPGCFISSGGYRRDIEGGHYGAVPLNTFNALIRHGWVKKTQVPYGAGVGYVITDAGLLALPEEAPTC